MDRPRPLRENLFCLVIHPAEPGISAEMVLNAHPRLIPTVLEELTKTTSLQVHLVVLVAVDELPPHVGLFTMRVSRLAPVLGEIAAILVVVGLLILSTCLPDDDLLHWHFNHLLYLNCLVDVHDLLYLNWHLEILCPVDVYDPLDLNRHLLPHTPVFTSGGQGRGGCGSCAWCWHSCGCRFGCGRPRLGCGSWPPPNRRFRTVSLPPILLVHSKACQER